MAWLLVKAGYENIRITRDTGGIDRWWRASGPRSRRFPICSTRPWRRTCNNGREKNDGVRGPCRGQEEGTGNRHGAGEDLWQRGPSCAWAPTPRVVVESIPTGSVALDLALGIGGGFPGGGSLRSMGRNPPGKPPWPCTSRQRPRSGGRGGLHRRGARSGPHLCPGPGGGH